MKRSSIWQPSQSSSTISRTVCFCAQVSSKRFSSCKSWCLGYYLRKILMKYKGFCASVKVLYDLLISFHSWGEDRNINIAPYLWKSVFAWAEILDDREEFESFSESNNNPGIVTAPMGCVSFHSVFVWRILFYFLTIHSTVETLISQEHRRASIKSKGRVFLFKRSFRWRSWTEWRWVDPELQFTEKRHTLV